MYANLYFLGYQLTTLSACLRSVYEKLGQHRATKTTHILERGCTCFPTPKKENGTIVLSIQLNTFKFHHRLYAFQSATLQYRFGSRQMERPYHRSKKDGTNPCSSDLAKIDQDRHARKRAAKVCTICTI